MGCGCLRQQLRSLCWSHREVSQPEQWALWVRCSSVVGILQYQVCPWSLSARQQEHLLCSVTNSRSVSRYWPTSMKSILHPEVSTPSLPHRRVRAEFSNGQWWHSTHSCVWVCFPHVMDHLSVSERRLVVAEFISAISLSDASWTCHHASGTVTN